MATATISNELGKSLSTAREKLSQVEQLLKETETRIGDESDELAFMQARRADECHQLALGKKADPSKLDGPIRNAEDKLSGLNKVKRDRERDVTEARANLQNIEIEVSRVEQKRALERERAETEELIAETRKALKARDEGERRVIDGIVALRNRTYLDPRTKSFAFDQAFSIQRNMNGMR